MLFLRERRRCSATDEGAIQGTLDPALLPRLQVGRRREGRGSGQRIVHQRSRRKGRGGRVIQTSARSSVRGCGLPAQKEGICAYPVIAGKGSP